MLLEVVRAWKKLYGAQTAPTSEGQMVRISGPKSAGRLIVDLWV